jgi:hypothetical protein
MPESNESSIFPKSPLEEVGGIPYFARMCDKIRLDANGDLSAEYQPNLGRGFDQWTCEYLRIDYCDLVEKVNGGMDDEAALEWAVGVGGERTSVERDWWLSYMRNRGFGDDFSEILVKRKSENGLEDRDDIVSFFGLIDADEGRN